MGFVVLHMEKAHGSDSGTTAHIERFIHTEERRPNTDTPKPKTHRLPRWSERPFGSNPTEIGRSGTDTQNRQQPSEGNPHQRVGNARGYGTYRKGRQIGRMVCRQYEILCRPVRQGKHRGCSSSSGRRNATHTHNACTIVKGERKRRKREELAKKRYRKKPTDTVRLCADDIMTRLKLKSYQDTYAIAMAKYGLQRGIDGSKARHKSTQQYYNETKKLADSLKAEVVDLQERKEAAKEELRQAKKEVQTEKLKGAATIAAANIAESVGSLFGSNKVKTLERENTALHREVATHGETIEALQTRIQTMQADHSRNCGKCSNGI